MKEGNKQVLLEALNQLKEQRAQIEEVLSAAIAEDAIESLGASVSIIDGVIYDIEDLLSVSQIQTRTEGQYRIATEKTKELNQEEQSKERVKEFLLVAIFVFPIAFLLIYFGINVLSDLLFIGIPLLLVGLFFMGLPFFFLSKKFNASPSIRSHTWESGPYDDSKSVSDAPVSFGRKQSDISNDERIRREIYAIQNEHLAILEDMEQMHNVCPDADLEEHYGWEYKMEFDAEEIGREYDF